MTLAEQISALLKKSPGRAICVGCVARTLELPHKRTHQGMLKLEAYSNVQRFFGQCALCGKTRLVVLMSGSAPASSPQPLHDSPSESVPSSGRRVQ